MATQLLRATVQIDESHLHNFIRTAVDHLAEQFKRDMHIVHRGISSLNERFDTLSGTVSELSERTVPGLVHDLAQLQESGIQRGHRPRSFKSLLNTSTISGGDSPSEGTTPGSPMSLGGVAHRAAKPMDPLEGSGKRSPASQGLDVDEDAAAFLELNERITALSEKVNNMEDGLADQNFHTSTLQSTLEVHQSLSNKNFTKLLDFIGLEDNEVYGGIIRAQVLANNQYLAEVSELLDQNSKRTTVVEANVKTKVDHQELDELNFAISDIRGVADAAVSTSIQKETQMKVSIQGFVNQIREENQSKVSWTDLDRWQASMDETSAATRNASIEAAEGLERLEKEFLIFKKGCLPTRGGAFQQIVEKAVLQQSSQSQAPIAEAVAVSTFTPIAGADPGSLPGQGATADGPSEGGGESSVRKKLSGATNYANYAQVRTAHEVVPAKGQQYTPGGTKSSGARQQASRPQSAAMVRRPLDFR